MNNEHVTEFHSPTRRRKPRIPAIIGAAGAAVFFLLLFLYAMFQLEKRIQTNGASSEIVQDVNKGVKMPKIIGAAVMGGPGGGVRIWFHDGNTITVTRNEAVTQGADGTPLQRAKVFSPVSSAIPVPIFPLPSIPNQGVGPIIQMLQQQRALINQLINTRQQQDVIDNTSRELSPSKNNHTDIPLVNMPTISSQAVPNYLQGTNADGVQFSSAKTGVLKHIGSTESSPKGTLQQTDFLPIHNEAVKNDRNSSSFDFDNVEEPENINASIDSKLDIQGQLKEGEDMEEYQQADQLTQVERRQNSRLKTSDSMINLYTGDVNTDSNPEFMPSFSQPDKSNDSIKNDVGGVAEFGDSLKSDSISPSSIEAEHSFAKKIDENTGMYRRLMATQAVSGMSVLTDTVARVGQAVVAGPMQMAQRLDAAGAVMTAPTIAVPYSSATYGYYQYPSPVLPIYGCGSLDPYCMYTYY